MTMPGPLRSGPIEGGEGGASGENGAEDIPARPNQLDVVVGQGDRGRGRRARDDDARKRRA